MRLATSDVFGAGAEHPSRVLDMYSEKAGDHDDNHDYADDVENIHCLAPIEDCATVEITSTPLQVQRRPCVWVPKQITRAWRRRGRGRAYEAREAGRIIICRAVACVTPALCQSVSVARQKSRAVASRHGAPLTGRACRGEGASEPSRPGSGGWLPLGLGLGIARRVRQRFGPRPWPPHLATEAIREAFFPARTIEPRQTCFRWKGFHGSMRRDRRRCRVRQPAQRCVDRRLSAFDDQHTQALAKLVC